MGWKGKGKGTTPQVSQRILVIFHTNLPSRFELHKIIILIYFLLFYLKMYDVEGKGATGKGADRAFGCAERSAEPRHKNDYW